MRVGVIRGPAANKSDMMTYQDASGNGVQFTFLGTHDIPDPYMPYEVYAYEHPETLLDRFDVLDVPDPLYGWARWFVRHHPCVVVTVWENLLSNMLYPYGGATRLEWWNTLEQAALVVARSPLAAAALKEFGVAPDKIVVIPAAVDTKRFRPAEKEPGSVLYLGRITWEKGIYDLISAAKGERWNLTIVGRGAAWTGGPGQFARALDIEPGDNLELLEAIPHEETAAMYAKSDVFAYPSLPTQGWQEQFGIAVIEAAASDCKVVLTHQASFKWIGSRIRNAFFAPPGDFWTLRQRIRQALSRHDHPGELTDNSFKSHHVGKILREHYAKLCL